MGSVLLPKVLEILEEYLVQRNEVSVEKQEDFHIFTEYCGSLCHWQENEDGTFREDSESSWVSEEEILQILRRRLSLNAVLATQHERRKRNFPGFHLESALLPLLLPKILEDCCLEEQEVGISYGYEPEGEPELEDLDNNSTWVTLYLKGSKKLICRWLEERNGDNENFIGDEEIHYWRNVKEAISSLRRKASPALAKETLRKLKEAKKKIEHLEERVEHLREKKRDIKYRPGKIGALKAQEHFEELAG